MSSKRRELATTFGNVAGNTNNNNTNINNVTDVSSNTSNNNDINYINNLSDNHSTSNTISNIVSKVESSKKDQPKKRQIAIYIDESIAKEFDKFGKKNGKGSKSELIEALLKEALK